MNKKLFTRIMALALAALIVLGCVAMLAGCSKSDPYANLGDAEYMQKVEKDNMEGTIEGLLEIYGALGKVNPSTAVKNHSKVEMDIQLGDMIIDMLEESYKKNVGSAMDFDFLANIGMDMEMSMQGDLMKEEMTILLNNKKVVSATVFMNMAQYVMYFAVPELNDEFVKLDMGAMGGTNVLPEMGGVAASGSPAALVSKLPEIMAKMPSEKDFAILLNRYIDIVLANLKNVTRSTETLEAGGLSQECTVISTKIYEADAKELAKAVLNAALTDEELKKAVDGISDVAGEDLYPAFKQSIEQALESLYNDSELDTENYIELITYIGADHQIIGRELFWPEQEDAVVTYYTVTSGDKFAFNAVARGVSLTGSGTEKKGAVTATYTLNVGGTDYVTLSVENFKSTEKELTGKVSIKPSAQLLRAIFGNTPAALADLTLEIQLATDGLTTKVMGNGTLIVSIAMKMKEASGGKIELPSNAVDINNSAALQQWMNGMKMDTIINNLKDAGVPSQLVDMLSQLVTGRVG